MEPYVFSSKELFAWRAAQLLKGGYPAKIDWLLDFGGGLSWPSLQSLYIDPSKEVLLKKSLKNLEEIWDRHLADQIPLQYLIGICPWRDFELEISSAALIPRQETECLIDLAISKWQNGFCGRWADLGTGSGVLAVALSRSFKTSIGHAVDCSKDALDLAKKNLNKLAPNSKVYLHSGSWWEPLKPWWGSLNLVLSNPPYIPDSLVDQLEPEVRNHEPLLALSGGDDGLDAVRQIIKGAKKALAPRGWLFIEHHHDQSDDVLEFMYQSGLNDLDFGNDLEGVRRFAIGRNS